MGQPNIARVILPYGERTQGSETSQYLQEKKSIEIPIVAASETGLGQLVIAFLLAEHFGKSEHRG